MTRAKEHDAAGFAGALNLRDGIVLATGDADWARTAREALDAQWLRDAPVLQLTSRDGIASRLCTNAALWIVDEPWVAPLLAHRRNLPYERQPDLLVRFEEFSTARVVAMIESGARGCLPASAGVAETREAIRAVLGGELWLSRRLFSAVLEYLQARPSPAATLQAEDDGLTVRQREIVTCVGRGMSNKQIARHLGISPTTVKTHLHNIFERIGVGGRTLLALRANEGHLN
ncbi:MAG: response regulator transcription factor [Pseudoxanthomonas sp.]